MNAEKTHSLILQAMTAHDPDSIAVIDDAGALTYKELLQAIDEAAAQLPSGCVLGIDLDNGREWLIWDLAALKAGAVCVPLPAFFSFEQMVHVLWTTTITHIISREGLKETELIQSRKDFPVGTAKITFTSGTTGKPKGVCLSRENMEDVAQSLVQVLGEGLADQHLSVMPLAILLENVAGIYATLLAGGTCHLYSLAEMGMAEPFVPDFAKLLQVMAEKRISSAILVPELLRGVMQALLKTGGALPDLEFLVVGGSRVSSALIRTARRLGLPVYEGYGLSECASVVALNTPAQDSAGTVGIPLPHIELECEDGEIVVKNPAFLGYVGEPHKGMLRTGDLGAIDKDGFLSVSGRRKNVLITSHGRNISPEWIESQLLACPDILQAVIYGDGQASIGALIVPSHREGDVGAAVAAVNNALPDYAHIRDFHVVEPFSTTDGTLTGNGRPRRNVILSKYQGITTLEKDNEFLQSAG